MAKSLRSKWKRKMRAEKRIRYGEKEKAKLIKMVESYAQERAAQEEEKQQEESPDVIPLSIGNEKMETTEAEGGEMRDVKKAKGSYPIWMSQRRIKKMKELAKKRKNPEAARKGSDAKKKYKKAQRKASRKLR